MDGTWNKIKYDRQIVAIAKVEGAQALYSDDPGVRAFGGATSLTIIGSWELPLPPVDPQASLDLASRQTDPANSEGDDETENGEE